MTGDINDLRSEAGCTCPPSERRSSRTRIVCTRCGNCSVAEADPTDTRHLAQDIVHYVGKDARPPTFAIALAEQAARDSPCQKSRRGASIYRMLEDLGDEQERVQQTRVCGYNGPPWVWSGDDSDYEMACDGSEACRRSCAQRCLHAEERALADLPGELADMPSLLRMVHVKIGADGRTVPGGRPSCVTCSRAILDKGIGGIWLFEKIHGSWFKDGKPAEGPGIWRYYPALDFHQITMTNTGVYQITEKPR